MTRSTIQNLVDRFSDHHSEYTAPTYKESALRHDFLDPFFEALGWDLFNQKNFSEAYREVIVEESLEVEDSKRAPDYCFRLGGRRVFFVEAKKPSINIKENIQPAYQVRRYAWSAKLPVSILTDFEEFSVYDCRVKPNATDKASTARVMYLKFDEYSAKWDELTALFSPEAIQKGSLDRWIGSSKTKKGTAEVDDAFLAEIEGWRELLARSIALRNPDLSQRDLNFVVQRTIDRIIFLRICEDRGIETYATLQSFQNGPGIYERLVEYFRRADERYNSGLFHFKNEAGQGEAPDSLTPRVKIDDKPLKEILKTLYYPDCPYEFSVLGADILGSVYERFLGNVIVFHGQRVNVEPKPEVRKAGGVYYTPTYIVDYIVKNTVGKLLEGKTPKQAADLRILDPACGSGSFLLGAYQHLMDWHLEQYTKEPDKWSKGKEHALYKSHVGGWKLTTQERKRILLNNIYGVDIDTQAVEVTKLSLLLKVLEGESGETINKQLKLFHQRALPDLGSNIRCGNSLIGPDFYQQQKMADLSEEDHDRINVFDWHKAFSGIMKWGGFDAVIGNPPYSAKQSIETKKLASVYSAVEYKCDPFAFFVERGLFLLKRGGNLGFIIPVAWMTNYYYRKLRELIVKSRSLKSIVLIDGLVFESANVDTCLLFLEKENVKNRTYAWIRTTAGCIEGQSKTRKYSAIECEERYDIVPNIDDDWARIKSNIDMVSVPLARLAKISLGMKLRSNDEYVVFKKDRMHPDPIYFGRDIDRYSSSKPQRYFSFENAVIVGGTKNPAIQKHKPKILMQAIRNLSLPRRIVATIEANGFCFVGTLNSIVLNNDCPYGYGFILGLLNSKLLNTYFKKRFTTISLTSAFIGVLPIKVIDNEDNASKRICKGIEGEVAKIMDLHSRLAGEDNPAQVDRIQGQIDACDQQIDHLVYELYGLTDEEIGIVEESSSQ